MCANAWTTGIATGAGGRAITRYSLFEHAKGRIKRGGDWRRVDLDNLDLFASASADQILTLDEAIEGLAAEDAVAADLVKLRYYAGLSIEQAAESMEISAATAYRHWAYARAWLLCALLDERE